MTSVSAGHIILTPTKTVGSGQPQRESNPGPPHQESRALPTELPSPPQVIMKKCQYMVLQYTGSSINKKKKNEIREFSCVICLIF